MSSDSKLVHIGITVTNINEFSAFYEKYFGFTLKRTGTFPPEFIADAPSLYRLEKGAYSDFGFLESPNGIVLELFQFNPILSVEDPLWNKPGYHHICLKVDSVLDTYKRMSDEGVEFYFEPKPLGHIPNAYWVFLKDPDGNMIELQETDL
ncbi:MAG: VOC family protein [Oscillospiraceae bacterium]|nr:VOC family protein [Oscillospiraceae bacterium]